MWPPPTFKPNEFTDQCLCDYLLQSNLMNSLPSVCVTTFYIQTSWIHWSVFMWPPPTFKHNEFIGQWVHHLLHSNLMNSLASVYEVQMWCSPCTHCCVLRARYDTLVSAIKLTAAYTVVWCCSENESALYDLCHVSYICVNGLDFFWTIR